MSRRKKSDDELKDDTKSFLSPLRQYIVQNNVPANCIVSTSQINLSTAGSSSGMIVPCGEEHLYHMPSIQLIKFTTMSAITMNGYQLPLFMILNADEIRKNDIEMVPTEKDSEATTTQKRTRDTVSDLSQKDSLFSYTFSDEHMKKEFHDYYPRGDERRVLKKIPNAFTLEHVFDSPPLDSDDVGTTPATKVRTPKKNKQSPADEQVVLSDANDDKTELNFEEVLQNFKKYYTSTLSKETQVSKPLYKTFVERKQTITFTRDTCIQWLKNSIIPYRTTECKDLPFVLILDSIKGYESKEFQALCKQYNIAVFIVPKSVSTLVHPSQLTFKKTLRSLYRRSLDIHLHCLGDTRIRNMVIGMPANFLVELVTRAFHKVPSKDIQDSFKKALL